MKKFLVLYMLAIAIIIPTAVADAVDVPSFRRVAGNYVPFKTEEIWRIKTCRRTLTM